MGRGLAAILPESVAGEDVGELRELPVGLIKPNPKQPRTNFDAEALAGLAASIETSGVVQPLPDQLRQQNLISLRIGRLLEFGEDLEMWLLRPNRASSTRCIFQKHHVSKPGSSRRFESSFAICSPYVSRAANGLFRSVIIIISEVAHLRFKFYGRQKLSIRDYQKVPLFFRAVPARQLDPLFAVNMSLL